MNHLHVQRFYAVVYIVYLTSHGRNKANPRIKRF